jgi:hypothetical protein
MIDADQSNQYQKDVDRINKIVHKKRIEIKEQLK